MSRTVALGPIEVAGTVAALAEGLRSLNVDAQVVLRERHPFGYPVDRILGRIGRPVYGLAVGCAHDVLHFQFGSTWLRGQLDARIAHRLGHVCVVTFHGDDCRLGAVAKEFFPARGRVKSVDGDAATRERLARLGPLCDAAIVNDFELATYVRPYFERIYLLPIPVGGSPPLPHAVPMRDRPVVLHSPSHPLIKGTAEIVAAVEAVSRKVPLDFRLLHGVPHARVQDELEECDIVVDQLNSVQPGIFAIEAMRRGLPVCGEIDRATLAPFQRDVPVVAVTPDTLASEVEALVAAPERRRELGERGRKYVEDVHAAPRVARAALNVYDHVRSAQPGSYVATPDSVDPIALPEWTARVA